MPPVFDIKGERMMNWCNEIKRGVCSYKLWGGIAIGIAVYYLSVSRNWYAIMNGLTSWVDVHNFIFMEFNGYKVLLPLAAAFPYCASIAEDWEHKNLNLIINRTSFNKYCNAKFFAASVLGGMVLALVLAINLFIMNENTTAASEYSYFEPFVADFLQNEQYAQYIFYFTSLQFVLGMLCAGIACIAAVITKNRGIIYFAPVLLLAMLEIVFNLAVIGLSAGQSLIVFRSSNQNASYVWCLIAISLGMGVAATYVVYRKVLRKRVYVW